MNKENVRQLDHQF